MVAGSIALFLVGALLGACDAQSRETGVSQRLGKGFGLIACLYSGLLLLDALFAEQNPMRQLRQLAVIEPMRERDSGFTEVDTRAQLEAQLAGARDDGQPVVIEFTADWCPACREMKAYTYPDPSVIAALEPFRRLRVDTSENSVEDRALMQHLGVYGMPTLVFFDRGGRLLDAYEITRYIPPAELREHLLRIVAP
jgi:thiol:disulfide interchange protein DsbD